VYGNDEHRKKRRQDEKFRQLKKMTESNENMHGN
jgi:hypothetical protein